MTKERAPKQIRKPRGFWTPANTEVEARSYIQNGRLTANMLEQAGRKDILGGVHNYPGGILALQKNLGLVPTKKATGFYTVENMEQTAATFVKTYGGISYKALENNGEAALAAAIMSKYPGKMTGLRQKLGQERKNKPIGYWKDPNNIEREAASCVQENRLTMKILGAAKRFDLTVAIQRNYPGGLTALKKKLGLVQEQRDRGHWTTPGIIEGEAREFVNQGQELTIENLRRQGRGDLAHAIIKHYNIHNLRVKLGLPDVYRTWGYWKNLENIKREARIFWDKHHQLTNSQLNSEKESALSYAIYKHYPGGIVQLRKDLCLEENQSVENANAQIEALLKD